MAKFQAGNFVTYDLGSTQRQMMNFKSSIRF